MQKNLFEKKYKEENCLWGLKPDKYIIEILKYKKSGDVLDIGVGEGRNSLFLARKGFNVTGIDISKNAIKKFKKLAEKKNLNVKGITKNITKFKFDKKYDIIISIATLHFLEKNEIYKLIKKIKKNTKKGGFNILEVFTEDNPFKNFPYLFKKRELKRLYKDWEIIKYKEFFTPFEKHDKKERLHRHAVAIIIAKKS